MRVHDRAHVALPAAGRCHRHTGQASANTRGPADHPMCAGASGTRPLCSEQSWHQSPVHVCYGSSVLPLFGYAHSGGLVCARHHHAVDACGGLCAGGSADRHVCRISAVHDCASLTGKPQGRFGVVQGSDCLCTCAAFTAERAYFLQPPAQQLYSAAEAEQRYMRHAVFAHWKHYRFASESFR